MSLGHKIIDRIIEGCLVDVEQKAPVVFVWSAAAPDQLDALVAEVTGFTEPVPSEHKRHGRATPYTATGIRRLPCYRCGEPAVHQWNACADGGLFRPLCNDCDAGLNEVALRFMGDPDVESKMAAYRLKLSQQHQ